MSRFPMLNFLRSMFERDRSTVERIHAMRTAFARLSEAELRAAGDATHARLNIFPDGGIARLRLFGRPR